MGLYDLALFGQGAMEGYERFNDITSKKRQQKLEEQRLAASVRQADTQAALDRARLDQALAQLEWDKQLYARQMQPIGEDMVRSLYNVPEGPLQADQYALGRIPRIDMPVYTDLERMQHEDERARLEAQMRAQALGIDQQRANTEASHYRATENLQNRQLGSELLTNVDPTIQRAVEAIRQAKIRSSGLPLSEEELIRQINEETQARGGGVLGQVQAKGEPTPKPISQRMQEYRQALAQIERDAQIEAVSSWLPQIQGQFQGADEATLAAARQKALGYEPSPEGMDYETYQRFYGPYAESGWVPPYAPKEPPPEFREKGTYSEQGPPAPEVRQTVGGRPWPEEPAYNPNEPAVSKRAKKLASIWSRPSLR